MGSVQVKQKNKNNTNLIDPPKIKINLEIDVSKPIPVHLLQLTDWSFLEIKTAYQAFQRVSESPIIDSFMFHKLMPYSKKNCDIIFYALTGGQKYLSMFELLCILTLTSFHTFKKKFQFFVLLFDLMHKGSINGRQFILVFESCVFGYCRLVGHQLPRYQTLSKFGQSSFFPGEDDFETKPVNLSKFTEEYEANPIIGALLNRFEKEELREVKQEFQIFSIGDLKKYSADEAEKYYRIIHKIYTKKDFSQIIAIEQNRELRRQNRRDDCFRKLLEEKERIVNLSSSMNRKNPKYSKSTSLIKVNSTPNGKDQYRIKKLESVQRSSLPASSRKLIFLKGQAFSKNDVFETISYFKSISNNQESVTIKEFFKRFQNKSFLKKQLSSIFKYLDYDKKGQITLEGFFRSFYPGINREDLEMLYKWYGSYQDIYEADSLAKNKKKIIEMSDARVLPYSTLERMKEIFIAMDIGNKGYLNFEDLRKAYKRGFTVDELEKMLKQFGKNNKIYLGALCRMLLPLGWTIEGVDLNKI